MPIFRPGKPRIRLTVGSGATIAANTDITWATVEDEEGEGWSAATPTRYTITKTGLWLVTFNVGSTAGSTTISNFGCRVSVNGVAVATHRVNTSITSGQFAGDGIAYLADLVDTDYLTAQLLFSAGTRNLDVGLTRLAATRIGPERWT